MIGLSLKRRDPLTLKYRNDEGYKKIQKRIHEKFQKKWLKCPHLIPYGKEKVAQNRSDQVCGYPRKSGDLFWGLLNIGNMGNEKMQEGRKIYGFFFPLALSHVGSREPL